MYIYKSKRAVHQTAHRQAKRPFTYLLLLLSLVVFLGCFPDLFEIVTEDPRNPNNSGNSSTHDECYGPDCEVDALVAVKSIGGSYSPDVELAQDTKLIDMVGGDDALVVNEYSIEVRGSENAALVAQSLNPGDKVAGVSMGGFLRQVDHVDYDATTGKVSLFTTDISLDEVVKKGSLTYNIADIGTNVTNLRPM